MDKSTGEPLSWGRGLTTLDIFIEPTCGHCGRAFAKLKPLLDTAGLDRLTLSIYLHSQPWHLFSPVVCRAIQAAAAGTGGKEAAWHVLETAFNHREELIAIEHCKGPNMTASPAEIINRLRLHSGIDVTATFESKQVTSQMKRHAKICRQNGIHSSPTFIVNGLVNPSMGSKDEISKWMHELEL